MTTEWEIVFYQDRQGNIPVQDFILGESNKVKAKILHYIELLQDLNLSLGLPYVKKLEDSDIWELRFRFGSDYYRLLYFAATGREFVLLHIFMKKTRKTPKSEVEIAERRMIDYKSRYID